MRRASFRLSLASSSPMALLAPRLAATISRPFASHTVQVVSEATARQTIAVFTTMSASMNIAQGDRSRGSKASPAATGASSPEAMLLSTQATMTIAPRSLVFVFGCKILAAWLGLILRIDGCGIADGFREPSPTPFGERLPSPGHSQGQNRPAPPQLGDALGGT